jgi:membrane-associated phospholipid phosphatase
MSTLDRATIATPPRKIERNKTEHYHYSGRMLMFITFSWGCDHQKCDEPLLKYFEDLAVGGHDPDDSRCSFPSQHIMMTTHLMIMIMSDKYIIY